MSSESSQKSSDQAHFEKSGEQASGEFYKNDIDKQSTDADKEKFADDHHGEPHEGREFEEGGDEGDFSEQDEEGTGVEEGTLDVDAKMARLAHTKAERIGGARRTHNAPAGGNRVAVAADLGLAPAIQHQPPSPKRAPKANPSTFHPSNINPKHQHERPKEMPTARQEPGSRYFQKGNKVRMSDVREMQKALRG